MIEVVLKTASRRLSSPPKPSTSSRKASNKTTATAIVPRKAWIWESRNSGLAVPEISWTYRTKGRLASTMNTDATYSVTPLNVPKDAS